MDIDPDTVCTLPATNRFRFTVVIFLLVLSTGGILFFSGRDIYSEIPQLEQLCRARANGWRASIARETWDPLEYSIEFYDGLGRRYQLRGVEKSAVDSMAAALPTEVPVIIRYGRWRSPFPSAKIFTIYQLEIGDRVIVPYSELANALRREQSAGPLILACTALAATFGVFVAVRRQRRFQQELRRMKSQTVNRP